MGTIDPLERVQECLDGFLETRGLSIWHHVDAAYGGFFACCARTELSQPWFDSLKQGFRGADSVTVDPHKLGYIPNAAGAVLVRDPRDYYLFNPGAPYLDADTEWPGAQILEGSRAATGPTVFWLSAHSLGLNDAGYGRLLQRTLKQRQDFQDLVQKDPRFLLLPGCHSNLALVALSPKRNGSVKLSDFERCVSSLMASSQKGSFGYHLSMTTFSLEDHEWLRTFLEQKGIELDRGELKALRMVFMNPFLDTRESHVRHIEKLVRELGLALDAITC
jgi:glutamate/tyrosine decarboxylase-like PLP-dependent enzyme